MQLLDKPSQQNKHVGSQEDVQFAPYLPCTQVLQLLLPQVGVWHDKQFEAESQVFQICLLVIPVPQPFETAATSPPIP
jgi:hypothetical protein